MGKNGGARPGAGRKSKAEELGLSRLIDEVCPIDEQKKIIKKLAEDAVSTTPAIRHPARTLLLSYKFGKPTERHEHLTPEGESLKVTVEFINDGK